MFTGLTASGPEMPLTKNVFILLLDGEEKPQEEEDAQYAH